MAQRLLASGGCRELVDLCKSIQMQDQLPSGFWFYKAKALEELATSRKPSRHIELRSQQFGQLPPDLCGHVGACYLAN